MRWGVFAFSPENHVISGKMPNQFAVSDFFAGIKITRYKPSAGFLLSIHDVLETATQTYQR